MIRTARPFCEAVHHLLDDSRACEVERICGLARLEENVRILCRTTQDWAVGCQRAVALLADPGVVNHRVQVVV